MKIIYYYNTNLQTAPAKQFLSKYDIKSSDNQKQKNHKDNMVLLIDGVIRKAAENKGIVGGLFSKPLKGMPFQEFRIKDSDNLNRIFYFCYHQDMLVLLNGFDKPDIKGERKKKRKVNKEEKKILAQTKEYYNDFINNPNNYEEY